MSKTIAILVGTRPNFIKITQFKREAEKEGLKSIIIHTGQHYDYKMAGSFFENLKISPDYFLDVKPGNPAIQIGNIIVKLSKLLEELKPDILIVPGDVNSTLAGAIAANKLNLKIAHLESGLRSNDERMPEEINRILTDRITNLFFVTEQSGIENLIAEKAPEKNIHFVGNTMIDTLVAFNDDIEKSKIREEIGVIEDYLLVTIHRPSNVDNPEQLSFIMELLEEISKNNKVVFPVHPRTINRLKHVGLFDKLDNNPNIIQTEPMDYFSFQNLILHAKLVLTDSGGIQEETTFRQVPCLTLRENTERPVTVDIGTNRLVPFDIKSILDKIDNVCDIKGQIPELWDGKATLRIIKILKKELDN